ncbi:HEAT repeat domain-containing protein [Hyphobacterium sp. HN65]|uniref:HEAT repeat domain-containing protein n=1 Tax=Hyphobacterium lacteum TaxID=3116575 RepID=A0ABU7LSB6_9PROT|nr:HEAT repeat domain-containing protein [Hyphobacterium sp. HN65]MEE2526810.1 HEAT repeat domain-containing protein [Hyphobacterium sp. HN65]
MIAGPLETLWIVSLGLAAASLIVMAGLIVSRMLGSYNDRQRDAVRQAIVMALYDVMEGQSADLGKLTKLIRHTRIAAQAVLEFSTLIRGEALEAAVRVLDELGLARHLIRLSRSSNAAARLAAIDALGYVGGPEATRRLARIANRSRDVEDRIAAVRALQLRGDAIDLDAVTGALRLIGNQLPGEFEAVLDNLARHSPAAVERILKTPGLPAIAYAQGLRSIGESGNYASLPLIMELAGSADTTLRIAALIALGTLGHPAAEPAITAGLAAESADVRAVAARAAGQATINTVQAQLTGLLDDPDWDVRINAARALAAMGDEGMEALRNKARTQPTARSGRTAQMLLAELGAFS